MHTLQKNLHTYIISIVCLFILFGCGGADEQVDSISNGVQIGSPTVEASQSNDTAEGAEPEVPVEEVITTKNFYFSYDDSGSTASRDLTIYALENQQATPQSWGRAYEFLTAESFTHFQESTSGPFNISIGLYQSLEGELVADNSANETLFALGVNVSGPEMSKEDRKNIVLTLLVDTSGSMDSSYARETRSDFRSLMDVVRHGLTNMTASLKSGDVINIVGFSGTAENVLEGWEFNSNNISGLTTAIEGFYYPDGSTNLDAGITLAYQLANQYYDAEKANRVVMLTDAYANTGELDTKIIAQNTVINGLEGIHFAGVGIGSAFNDAFLNELTDIGKGVYSAMITPTDAERIFTKGFIRFIDHAVENIRFQLTYPETWQHVASAAEQVSENKDDVQTVNFSYNSSQFFLEQFTADIERDGTETESIKLSITYDEDGINKETIIDLPLESILGKGESEIKAAAAVYVLAGLVSNSINCTDVSESGLYSQEIEHDIFTKYKSAINLYCQW